MGEQRAQLSGLSPLFFEEASSPFPRPDWLSHSFPSRAQSKGLGWEREREREKGGKRLPMLKKRALWSLLPPLGQWRSGG